MANEKVYAAIKAAKVTVSKLIDMLETDQFNSLAFHIATCNSPESFKSMFNQNIDLEQLQALQTIFALGKFNVYGQGFNMPATSWCCNEYPLSGYLAIYSPYEDGELEFIETEEEFEDLFCEELIYPAR